MHHICLFKGVPGKSRVETRNSRCKSKIVLMLFGMLYVPYFSSYSTTASCAMFASAEEVAIDGTNKKGGNIDSGSGNAGGGLRWRDLMVRTKKRKCSICSL